MVVDVDVDDVKIEIDVDVDDVMMMAVYLNHACIINTHDYSPEVSISTLSSSSLSSSLSSSSSLIYNSYITIVCITSTVKFYH